MRHGRCRLTVLTFYLAVYAKRSAVAVGYAVQHILSPQLTCEFRMLLAMLDDILSRFYLYNQPICARHHLLGKHSLRSSQDVKDKDHLPPGHRTVLSVYHLPDEISEFSHILINALFLSQNIQSTDLSRLKRDMLKTEPGSTDMCLGESVKLTQDYKKRISLTRRRNNELNSMRTPGKYESLHYGHMTMNG